MESPAVFRSTPQTWIKPSNLKLYGMGDQLEKKSKTSPDHIFEKALQSEPISDSDLRILLRIEDSRTLDRLFQTARLVRGKYFGTRVFLYGFIYINTHCRNNCRFCLYRAANTSAPRYRKTGDEIVKTAQILKSSGVHLIDLTLGEDPAFFHRTNRFVPFFDVLEQLMGTVDLPVMVSPGMVPASVLQRLAGTGVRWFACYQETYNRQLFERLREGQDFENRREIKRVAKQLGFLVEDGLLCGVGESDADLLDSITAMGRLEVDQMRVMTFIPQPGTPMGGRPAADPLRELKIIALMRLCFPHLLIPATLDVGGTDGLQQRLNAGANVVTSIVPPGRGLAGVAQNCLDIEAGRRSVDGIRQVLDLCGLTPASSGEYEEWMQRRLTARGWPGLFRQVSKC